MLLINTFLIVLLVWSAVVFLHLLGVFGTRLGVIPKGWGASLLLILLILGGSLFLTRLVAASPIPASLRVGAVCLYLAGCLGYIQMRALLSRGYSLRILIDLSEMGGTASIQTLKNQYGGGVGVEGKLSKTLKTLGQLKFLGWDGRLVGPLTFLGKCSAWFGFNCRRLLRLDQVG